MGVGGVGVVGSQQPLAQENSALLLGNGGGLFVDVPQNEGERGAGGCHIPVQRARDLVVEQQRLLHSIECGAQVPLGQVCASNVEQLGGIR